MSCFGLAIRKMCDICLDVFRDPVMIDKCEHIFCRACLNQCLKNNKKCPVDRQAISKRNVGVPSRFFRNFYDRLEMKLVAKRLSIVRYEAHVAKCDFSQLECSTKCGFVGCKRQLEEHEHNHYLQNEIQSLKEQLNVATQSMLDASEMIRGMYENAPKYEITKARQAIGRLKVTMMVGAEAGLAWTDFFPLFVQRSSRKDMPHFDFAYYTNDDRGFVLAQKDLIIACAADAVSLADNYANIAFNTEKSLRKLMKEEDWHVFVGHAFDGFLTFSKTFSFNICNIDFIVISSVL